VQGQESTGDDRHQHLRPVNSAEPAPREGSQNRGSYRTAPKSYRKGLGPGRIPNQDRRG
jgi:hypothetical protein